MNSAYLNLVREFSVAQFKLRDRKTLLGLVWTVLHPLAILVLMYFMFKAKFASGIDHFSTYVIIGIVHITHFSNSTSSTISLLRNTKHLVLNTTFPKEILVISSVLSNTVEFAFSLVICLIIAFVTGILPASSMFLIPVVMLMQILLVTWVSMFLSIVSVFIADISHLYQILLRMLFFITPVFYTLNFLDVAGARRIALVNPLTHLMMFTRRLIIEGNGLPLESAAPFLLANGGLVVISLILFRKFEPVFAEHL